MSSPPLPLITQIKEGHYLYPPFHEHPQSSRARVVGKPACSGLFFSPGHGISPGSLFCPCTPMGIRVNNGFRSAKCEGTDVAKAYDGGKHQARCFLLVQIVFLRWSQYFWNTKKWRKILPSQDQHLLEDKAVLRLGPPLLIGQCCIPFFCKLPLGMILMQLSISQPYSHTQPSTRKSR